MKTRIISIVATLLFSPILSYANTIAAKTYYFEQNDTIVLPLSSVNTNRLVVKDDKIVNLHCPRGFCLAKANQRDQSGSITVKLNIALPFTAHVTTEKGQNFSLFINPMTRPK